MDLDLPSLRTFVLRVSCREVDVARCQVHWNIHTDAMGFTSALIWYWQHLLYAHNRLSVLQYWMNNSLISKFQTISPSLENMVHTSKAHTHRNHNIKWVSKNENLRFFNPRLLLFYQCFCFYGKNLPRPFGEIKKTSTPFVKSGGL